MSFQIINVSGVALRANTHFKYRGHVVSLSTIFGRPEVAIWTDTKNAELQRFETVEAALNHINSIA